MSTNAFDVHAAAAGDREAFARLIEQTQVLVRATALAILGNVERSEDVAQEVYLAAWSRLRSLRSPEKFEPWLRQIARNRAQSARTRAAAPLDAAARVEDPGPAPLDSLIATEDARRIELALASLSEADREVLVLHYRDGASMLESAELLGVSEEVFRKRLSRARARLREEVLRPAEESLRRPLPALAPLVLARLPLGNPPPAPRPSLARMTAGTTASVSAILIAVVAIVAAQSRGTASGAARTGSARTAKDPHAAAAMAQRPALETKPAQAGATPIPPAVAGAIIEVLASPEEKPEDEAKQHLAGFLTAEFFYHREHHAYSDDLIALDWFPGADSPHYVFGFCTGGPRSHSMKPEVAAAPSEPVSMTGTLALADPCAALTALGIDTARFVASRDGFQAFAIGNIDDDPDFDVWSIDEKKQLVHLHADRTPP